MPIDPGSSELNPRNGSFPVPTSNRTQQLLYVRNVDQEQDQGQEESDEEEDEAAGDGRYADEQDSSYETTLVSRFADKDRGRKEDEVDEAQDQDQDSYETPPIPRYVVDLGIVKAFSAEPDFIVPSSSHPSVTHYKGTAPKRLVPILTFKTVITAAIIIATYYFQLCCL